MFYLHRTKSFPYAKLSRLAIFVKLIYIKKPAGSAAGPNEKGCIQRTLLL